MYSICIWSYVVFFDAEVLQVALHRCLGGQCCEGAQGATIP